MNWLKGEEISEREHKLMAPGKFLRSTYSDAVNEQTAVIFPDNFNKMTMSRQFYTLVRGVRLWAG